MSNEAASRIAAPDVAVLVQRARDLRPLIAKKAEATERDRRVSTEVMDLLNDNGLLSVMRPARFGGWQYGPSAMFRIGFEIGRACGSTAWCAMIANCDAWFASYWPLEAQHEIWGVSPRTLIAGTLAPTGKCEPEEGGWRVWGHWPFASNCENSQFAVVAAMLPETADGPAGVGWFLVPISSLTIDQNSWRVAGLQGTGSKTLSAEEPIFVPAHRVVRFTDIEAGSPPGAAIPGNDSARYSFTTFSATALVGPLLGMAQGALDWFVEAMKAKTRVPQRPGAPVSASSSPFTQERAGRASAAIDSAIALLTNDLHAAEALIGSGETLDSRVRVRIRRDFGFAARQAVDAVNILFDGAGASAAALDQPIQRFWRDVNAGAHHVSLDQNAINSMVGQSLFGLPVIGIH